METLVLKQGWQLQVVLLRLVTCCSFSILSFIQHIQMHIAYQKWKSLASLKNSLFFLMSIVSDIFQLAELMRSKTSGG